jgi:hypothetical protein
MTKFSKNDTFIKLQNAKELDLFNRKVKNLKAVKYHFRVIFSKVLKLKTLVGVGRVMSLSSLNAGQKVGKRNGSTKLQKLAFLLIEKD